MKRLYQRVLDYKKSEFIINASKLMTGSVLSQLLPILAAPILARIYQPSDYGALGLYMSLTGIIGMFGTLQYANAIVIAKSEDEVRALIKLCLQILLVVTTLVLLVVILLKHNIALYLKVPELEKWLWFAPFSILMGGFSLIFSNYSVRHKYFGLISSNRIIASVVTTLSSITIGYLLHNPVGLFVGLWVGQLISGFILCIRSVTKGSSESMIKSMSGLSINTVWKKHINFPKYSLPSDFINMFTNQIPLFMLNAYASTDAVGKYNMGNRILGLPVDFLSGSIGEIFRQRASQDYNETGSCNRIFVKTFKTLTLLSIIPFSILILFSPNLFAFILGEKWRGAGQYAQIMGIMFFFRFTISPLTYMYYIANRQKEDFYLHLLFLIVAYASFKIGFQTYGSANIALLVFSILYSCIYIIYLVRSYQFSLGVQTKKIN